MIQTNRSQALMLIAVLGIVALVAQLAGVGTGSHKAAAKSVRLASKAGMTVPDLGSTKLATTKLKVNGTTVVRMHVQAKLQVQSLGKASSGTAVCGIQYGRAGDRSWTLGTIYDSYKLTRGMKRTITIDRSFNAPATDTYSSTLVCHVQTPASGANVVASDAKASIATGLPKGASKPA